MKRNYISAMVYIIMLQSCNSNHVHMRSADQQAYVSASCTGEVDLFTWVSEQGGNTLSRLIVKDGDVFIWAAGGEECTWWVHLHLKARQANYNVDAQPPSVTRLNIFLIWSSHHWAMKDLPSVPEPPYLPSTVLLHHWTSLSNILSASHSPRCKLCSDIAVNDQNKITFLTISSYKSVQSPVGKNNVLNIQHRPKLIIFGCKLHKI